MQCVKKTGVGNFNEGEKMETKRFFSINKKTDKWFLVKVFYWY